MGKPDLQKSSITEFIGYWSKTQGTETSKYLEEKKSTEILEVVASETRTAQIPYVSTK